MKRIYIKPKIEELVCDNEQFLCASDTSHSLDGQNVGENTIINAPDGARTEDPFFEEYDEY